MVPGRAGRRARLPERAATSSDRPRRRHGDGPDPLGLDLRRSAGPGAWTGEWYLHLFAPEQPDLNWENPRSRASSSDILRFWLDRGVDGFRIDVAHALAKDHRLPRRRRRRRLGVPRAATRTGTATRSTRSTGWRKITTPTGGERRMFVAEAWLPRPGWRATSAPTELHTAPELQLPEGAWDAEQLREVIDETRTDRAVGARHVGAVQPRRRTATHPLRRGVTESRQPMTRRRARAAAACCCSPCPAGPTSTRARSWACPRSSTCPRPPRQDPIWRTGAPARAGTVAGCRSRGPGLDPSYRARGDGLLAAAARGGRADGRAPGRRSTSSPRWDQQAAGDSTPAPGARRRDDAAPRGSTTCSPSGARGLCVVNFGAELALPAELVGAEVLLAAIRSAAATRYPGPRRCGWRPRRDRRRQSSSSSFVRGRARSSSPPRRDRHRAGCLRPSRSRQACAVSPPRREPCSTCWSSSRGRSSRNWRAPSPNRSRIGFDGQQEPVQGFRGISGDNVAGVVGRIVVGGGNVVGGGGVVAGRVFAGGSSATDGERTGPRAAIDAAARPIAVTVAVGADARPFEQDGRRAERAIPPNARRAAAGGGHRGLAGGGKGAGAPPGRWPTRSPAGRR